MPKANSDNDAVKCLSLVPRVIGDVKSIAKRITPEGQPWPDEVRACLRYFRELEEELEQQFPNLIR